MVANYFVEKQDNRGSVGFSKIKSVNGDAENILMVGRCKSYNTVITVGAPSGLVDISLADVSRVAGRWPAALDIDDDEGDLTADGK